MWKLIVITDFISFYLVFPYSDHQIKTDPLTNHLPNVVFVDTQICPDNLHKGTLFMPMTVSFLSFLKE